MKLTIIKTFRPAYGLMFLLISIVLSVLISTSVSLITDKLGALLNIYVPVLTGIFSIVIFTLSCIFRRSVFFGFTCIILVLINLATGVYLKQSFSAFLNGQSDQTLLKSPLNFYSTSAPIKTYKGNANISIENLDSFPDNNTLVFSLIYKPPGKRVRVKYRSLNNQDHDKVAIRITNSGSANLMLFKALFSDEGVWMIEDSNGIIKFPFQIAAHSYIDLNVTFTGERISRRIAPLWWKAILTLQHNMLNPLRSIGYQVPVASTCLPVKGALYLYSNDEKVPVTKINLSSIWQYRIEGDWEPDLQMQLAALNFKTTVGFRNFDNGITGDRVVPFTDEVATDFFRVADIKLPVSIKKLSAYHGCCLPVNADTLKYYHPQKKNGLKAILFNNAQSAQMLLPLDIFAAAGITRFKPGRFFGLQIGKVYTDRAMNYHNKIGIRIWKARAVNGLVVKNAYIIGNDYLGTKGTNYDYQDNVYYVSNVVPVKGNQ